VGVKTLCKDKPFRVFKDSEEYSKWLVHRLRSRPAERAAAGGSVAG
jgi:hypothetical protein